MLVSGRIAKEAAWMWWSEHKGEFPYPCVSILGKADEARLSGRRVDIRLMSDTTYIVIKLFIENDGTVAVLDDRRDKILATAACRTKLAAIPDFEEEHRQSVALVTEAVHLVRTDYPSWFSHIEIPETCVRDSLVDITVVMVGRKARYAKVKIKVVNSLLAKTKFNSRLSDQDRLRRITLIVRTDSSCREIRNDLVGRFRQLRREVKLA